VVYLALIVTTAQLGNLNVAMMFALFCVVADAWGRSFSYSFEYDHLD
jgi:hypothetical protein